MKIIVHQIINVVSIVVLLYFSIPKLIGLPVSIAGFTQFESVLGINANLFRVFTGLSELAIVILILVYILSSNKIIGIIAFLFLLVTMVSALTIEFFVRPQPVTLLVIVAIILAAFSIYKLKSIQSHE